MISEFGLNPNVPDLKEARAYFSARNVEDYIADVLRRANVTEVVMTNDIFDRTEAAHLERKSAAASQVFMRCSAWIRR